MNSEPTASSEGVLHPPSKPLPQAEQDQLLSLLQQLGQGSNSSSSASGSTSNSQAKNLTVEASHAAKRKLGEYSDGKDLESRLLDNAIEESRAKRVAV